MQFPIIIGLRRSRILASLNTIAATLAGVATMALPANAIIQLSILLLVLGSWLIGQKALNHSARAIRLERADTISVKMLASEEYLPATLQPGVFIHPYLSAFRVVLESGRACQVVLTVDSINRADFRKLRIFLRWRATAILSKGDV